MWFLFVRPEVCPWLVCSHIRLPSDSTSQWTPLPSAIPFPLPGWFGTFTRQKRAPPGALAYENRLPAWTAGLIFYFAWTGSIRTSPEVVPISTFALPSPQT
jgi:hypothetical protein